MIASNATRLRIASAMPFSLLPRRTFGNGSSVAKQSRSSATSAAACPSTSRARASTSLSASAAYTGSARLPPSSAREDVELARDDLHLRLLERRARRVRERRPALERHPIAALVQVRDVVGAPRETAREIAHLHRARPRVARTRASPKAAASRAARSGFARARAVPVGRSNREPRCRPRSAIPRRRRRRESSRPSA